MHPVAIVISALALALSIFTFYWTALRKRRAFYLLRVGNAFFIDGFQFALINGGKDDLLITSLECFFEHKDGNGGFYPAQTISFHDKDGTLLAAGKAIHCKLNFPEPFTTTFALSGRKEPGKDDFYLHQLNVEIQWVDMSGEIYKKAVPHSIVGFDEKAKLCMVGPRGEKHDLYAK